jgi:hypothetical protein
MNINCPIVRNHSASNAVLAKYMLQLKFRNLHLRFRYRPLELSLLKIPIIWETHYCVDLETKTVRMLQYDDNAQIGPDVKFKFHLLKYFPS